MHGCRGLVYMDLKGEIISNKVGRKTLLTIQKDKRCFISAYIYI